MWSSCCRSSRTKETALPGTRPEWRELKDISLAMPDSPAAARVYAAAGLPSLQFKAEPPFVAALEIRVAEAGRARTHLVRENLPHRVAPDGALEIPPDQPCGPRLRLRRG
jgi:hypothetical protein